MTHPRRSATPAVDPKDDGRLRVSGPRDACLEARTPPQLEGPR